MKILIASDCYKPTINGIVTSIINLKKGLEELGHEVRVITLSSSTKSFRDGDVYYIGSFDIGRVYPGIMRVQITNTRKEVENIEMWKPDIIHTQSEFSTFFMAKRIAKKLSIPIIHTYHTVYEDYTHYFSTSKRLGKKVVVSLTNFYGGNVDGMVAPTKKINGILDKYGVSCPIHIVPTGINMERFQEVISTEELIKLKKSLLIPEDNTVMLSVSRIGKEKKIDELISYMDNVRDKKITLVVVGDGPEKEKLINQVRKLNLSDRVKFTGSVPYENISRYYHMSDLFVSASTSETQGLTYIEALATGTPIMCRKDDCLDGVLEEFENGYSFESDEEFYKKLDMFMQHKDSKEMAINAKKTAEKFSKENFAKALVNLYQVYTNSNSVNNLGKKSFSIRRKKAS